MWLILTITKHSEVRVREALRERQHPPVPAHAPGGLRGELRRDAPRSVSRSLSPQQQRRAVTTRSAHIEEVRNQIHITSYLVVNFDFGQKAPG